MIALKTSPLLFGHKIILVFHLFLLFHVNSMTYDLYNFQKVLHIIYYFCYCIAFVNCPWKKKLEFSVFFIMSSFVLGDTYLVIWKCLIIVTVISVIAAIEDMCIFLLHWFAIRVQS